MPDTVISFENVSKLYRLGLIGSGTLSHDLNRWWARMRGKPDPLLKIGERDHGNRDGEFIWALRDVSLEVKEGEILGIIGRNGAGKSTLLKVLSQVTAPTAGQIRVKGRVASLLEVGTGFHPELTGRENIYLNGAILGMTKVEITHKFDEIVVFSGVEKFIDTPVKRYSSGMYVRLAFAVAAHLEPEILVVDEVLAVGDAEFQKKCLGKMEDVSSRNGRTVLFVSHNMRAVERLCGRALLLQDGKIAQHGFTKQVIAEYLGSGMRQTGERVWASPAKGPGDESVRLRAVRAVGADGKVASEFKVTEPFGIETEFWVLSPGFLLDVGLKFYNEDGILVFATADFQDVTWQNRPRPVGIHRSTCHVPANLLAEGTINILAAVVTNPHTVHVRETDSITVRIVDDWQPGGTRGNYTLPWPGGIVRPLTKWTFGFEPLDNRPELHGNGTREKEAV